MQVAVTDEARDAGFDEGLFITLSMSAAGQEVIHITRMADDEGERVNLVVKLDGATIFDNTGEAPDTQFFCGECGSYFDGGLFEQYAHRVDHEDDGDEVSPECHSCGYLALDDDDLGEHLQLNPLCVA